MAHIDDSPSTGNSSNSINGNIFFANKDIDRARTLNPFTHVYMFDVGFPAELHLSIAIKFNTSLYATHLISYQPPIDIIREFGFKVQFMGEKFNTSMHGWFINALLFLTICIK
jgi:hypothetical protein